MGMVTVFTLDRKKNMTKKTHFQNDHAACVSVHEVKRATKLVTVTNQIFQNESVVSGLIDTFPMTCLC